MKPDLVKELQEAAAAAGAELTEQTSKGHFHIRGAVLVNYWPLSKQRTAVIAGEMKGKSCTPAEAVAMAFPEGHDPDVGTTFTLFGRLVSEEEFRAHQMPEDTGIPWEKE